ncbi:hypothetical protein [Alteribacter populi]|uniref:hypothetical protein n=1 Tax=Alteribacter populi TaxID=2011011 RepID=UPI000BBACDC4|nr:hypothetical protein [Alteribacter populi]
MVKCICTHDNSSVDCNICNGTGIDDRKWYLLVGWSKNSYSGYWKFTSDWNEVLSHQSEGMELYGYASDLKGISKLSNEFYKSGGWFYR